MTVLMIVNIVLMKRPRVSHLFLVSYILFLEHNQQLNQKIVVRVQEAADLSGIAGLEVKMRLAKPVNVIHLSHGRTDEKEYPELVRRMAMSITRDADEKLIYSQTIRRYLNGRARHLFKSQSERLLRYADMLEILERYIAVSGKLRGGPQAVAFFSPTINEVVYNLTEQEINDILKSKYSPVEVRSLILFIHEHEQLHKEFHQMGISFKNVEIEEGIILTRQLNRADLASIVNKEFIKGIIEQLNRESLFVNTQIAQVDGRYRLGGLVLADLTEAGLREEFKEHYLGGAVGCIDRIFNSKKVRLQFDEPRQAKRAAIGIINSILEIEGIDSYSSHEVWEIAFEVLRHMIYGDHDEEIKNDARRSGLLALDNIVLILRRVGSNALETLARIAAMGNSWDLLDSRYIVQANRDRKLHLAGIEEELKREDFWRFNNIKEFDKLLNKPLMRVLYLVDNVGEDAIDLILVRELLVRGNTVVMAAKALPCGNDSTEQDLRTLIKNEQVRALIGEENLSRLSIIDSGSIVFGTDLARTSKEFEAEWEKADLIISKGQANYFTLRPYSLTKPCLYLFRVKWPAEANIVEQRGFSRGDYIAELVDISQQKIDTLQDGPEFDWLDGSYSEMEEIEERWLDGTIEKIVDESLPWRTRYAEARRIVTFFDVAEGNLAGLRMLRNPMLREEIFEEKMGKVWASLLKAKNAVILRTRMSDPINQKLVRNIEKKMHEADQKLVHLFNEEGIGKDQRVKDKEGGNPPSSIWYLITGNARKVVLGAVAEGVVLAAISVALAMMYGPAVAFGLMFFAVLIWAGYHVWFINNSPDLHESLQHLRSRNKFVLLVQFTLPLLSYLVIPFAVSLFSLILVAVIAVLWHVVLDQNRMDQADGKCIEFENTSRIFENRLLPLFGIVLVSYIVFGVFARISEINKGLEGLLQYILVFGFALMSVWFYRVWIVICAAYRFARLNYLSQIDVSRFSDKKIRLINEISSLSIGGAEQVTLRLVNAIDKNKYDVIVLTHESDEKYEELISKARKVGVQFIFKEKGVSLKQLLLKFRVLKFIEEVITTFVIGLAVYQAIRPDVAHFQMVSHVRDFIKKAVLRIFTNCSVVVTTYHNIPQIYQGTAKGLLRKTKVKLVHVVNLLGFVLFDDLLIALTEKEKQLHNKSGVPLYKMAVVPNGIDAKIFIEAPGDVETLPFGDDLKAILRDDKNIIIGTVGRLVPQKGYPDLIKAAQIAVGSMDNIYFLIVGEGQERESLEAQIKSAGLQERFFMPGRVEHDDMPALYAAFDVFVMSSIHEGLPTVGIEALFAKKPFIGTDIIGIPEIIGRDERSGLLTKPRDPADMAEKIIGLTRDPQRMERMGEEGQKRALEQFCVERAALDHQAIYERILLKGINKEQSVPPASLWYLISGNNRKGVLGAVAEGVALAAISVALAMMYGPAIAFGLMFFAVLVWAGYHVWFIFNSPNLHKSLHYLRDRSKLELFVQSLLPLTSYLIIPFVITLTGLITVPVIAVLWHVGIDYRRMVLTHSFDNEFENVDVLKILTDTKKQNLISIPDTLYYPGGGFDMQAILQEPEVRTAVIVDEMDDWSIILWRLLQEVKYRHPEVVMCEIIAPQMSVSAKSLISSYIDIDKVKQEQSRGYLTLQIQTSQGKKVVHYYYGHSMFKSGIWLAAGIDKGPLLVKVRQFPLFARGEWGRGYLDEMLGFIDNLPAYSMIENDHFIEGDLKHKEWMVGFGFDLVTISGREFYVKTRQRDAKAPQGPVNINGFTEGSMIGDLRYLIHAGNADSEDVKAAGLVRGHFRLPQNFKEPLPEVKQNELRSRIENIIRFFGGIEKIRALTKEERERLSVEWARYFGVGLIDVTGNKYSRQLLIALRKIAEEACKPCVVIKSGNLIELIEKTYPGINFDLAELRQQEIFIIMHKGLMDRSRLDYFITTVHETLEIMVSQAGATDDAFFRDFGHQNYFVLEIEMDIANRLGIIERMLEIREAQNLSGVAPISACKYRAFLEVVREFVSSYETQVQLQEPKRQQRQNANSIQWPDIYDEYPLYRKKIEAVTPEQAALGGYKTLENCLEDLEHVLEVHPNVNLYKDPKNNKYALKKVSPRNLIAHIIGERIFRLLGIRTTESHVYGNGKERFILMPSLARMRILSSGTFKWFLSRLSSGQLRVLRGAQLIDRALDIWDRSERHVFVDEKAPQDFVLFDSDCACGSWKDDFVARRPFNNKVLEGWSGEESARYYKEIGSTEEDMAWMAKRFVLVSDDQVAAIVEHAFSENAGRSLDRGHVLDEILRAKRSAKTFAGRKRERGFVLPELLGVIAGISGFGVILLGSVKWSGVLGWVTGVYKSLALPTLLFTPLLAALIFLAAVVVLIIFKYQKILNALQFSFNRAGTQKPEPEFDSDSLVVQMRGTPSGKIWDVKGWSPFEGKYLYRAITCEEWAAIQENKEFVIGKATLFEKIMGDKILLYEQMQYHAGVLVRVQARKLHFIQSDFHPTRAKTYLKHTLDKGSFEVSKDGEMWFGIEAYMEREIERKRAIADLEIGEARLLPEKTVQWDEVGLIKDKLKAAVKAEQGTVSFLIHPGGEFLGSVLNGVLEPVYERTDIYISNLRKYLSGATGVVFVLGGFYELIKDVRTRAVIVEIPTKRNNDGAQPIPALKTKGCDFRWSEWNPVIEFMKDIGVEKLSHFGGELAVVDEYNHVKKSLHDYGCVGGGLEFLSRYFSINVYPQLCCGKGRNAHLGAKRIDEGNYWQVKAENDSNLGQPVKRVEAQKAEREPRFGSKYNDKKVIFRALNIDTSKTVETGKATAYVSIEIQGYDPQDQGKLLLLIYKGKPVCVLKENNGEHEKRYLFDAGFFELDHKVDREIRRRWLKDNFGPLLEGVDMSDINIKGIWRSNEESLSGSSLKKVLYDFRGVFSCGINSTIPMIRIMERQFEDKNKF